MMRNVFKCNPYVVGIGSRATVLPGESAVGDGHVLQRVLQGFELPIDPLPRPEVYLDNGERAWAASQRRRWPSVKPPCLLSAGAITDRGNLEQVNWSHVARILAEHYTIIQAVLSEPEIPGAFVYRGLPLRRYMALFSVVDCFFGGTSGGSHLAAAFDIPAVVVIWRSLLRELRFPVSGLGITAAFLYPQHWFVAAEDLSGGASDEMPLAQVLNDVRSCGRRGRVTSIGQHPRNPCGFIPRAPVRLALSGGRRIVRIPSTYGSPPGGQGS
jgi:hypothetical protein